MPSYSRFSHHARRALTHAGLLVQRYHHPRIDTGHLLVGVLLAEGSIGSAVLKGLSLDESRAGPALAALTRRLDTEPENPPRDAALDIALDLAADESTWLGHHYIGTEHLLLGITRTNIGNAADLLHELGVQPDQLRQRVRSALKDGATEFNLDAIRRSARFSELSRRVITAAEQMAVAMDHPTIGLGHLLVALLRERRSPNSTLLQRSGLDITGIEARLRAGDPDTLVSVEQVLRLAGEHARTLGSHFTGTEHILLALTIDGQGIALLRHFDADPDMLRSRVAHQLSGKR